MTEELDNCSEEVDINPLSVPSRPDPVPPTSEDSVCRNAIAEALLARYGYVRLSARYAAADTAMAMAVEDVKIRTEFLASRISGDELCNHDRPVPRMPCAACMNKPIYAAYKNRGVFDG